MAHELCSRLLPLYHSWKLALSDMRVALEAYQESGSEADQRDFDTAYARADEAMRRYRSAAYPKFFKECAIGGRVHRLFVDDAAMMVRIIKDFDFPITLDFAKSFQGRVISLLENKVEEHLRNSVAFVDLFLAHVACLKGLRVLCVPSGTGIMPNALPETIEEIKIESSYIKVLPEYHLPRLTALDLTGTKIFLIPQSIVGGLLKKLLLPETIQILPEISTTSLAYLKCSHCKNITQMPQLPSTIKILLLDNSSITSLTDLPGGMHEVDIANTPAAQDEATRKYLKEYTERNPATQITY